MWNIVWDWFKGLFGGGKSAGTTQAGSGNVAVTSSTGGDHSPVFAAARDLHIHAAPPPRDPPRQDVPRLSPDATILLLEAATKGQGSIIRTRSTEGLAVCTGNKGFVQFQDPETQQHWWSVVEELLDADLIRGRGSMFEVTEHGYKVARLLDSYDIEKFSIAR
jgi:hypothetical protein